MVVIYAEKGDMGKKIAAALDAIHLHSGENVSFAEIERYSSAIEKQQRADGFLEISFHGSPACVTWGWGHMCELKQAQDYDPEYKDWNKLPVPFIPEKYELMPARAEGFFAKRNAKQMRVIKDLFNKADYIINATDDDREGELIFAYVYEYLRCKKPVKRALYSSTVKEAFVDAFNDLVDGSERKNVERAGRARSIADWIVGSNLTAQMTLHNNTAEVLSIGRVQTPTLNLLVKREAAIKGFTSEKYYSITAEFKTSAGKMYKAVHKTKQIKGKEEADKILAEVKGKDGIVATVEKKVSKIPPQELYSQSALQMECNKKFGMKLTETLEITQSLYDKGYTTYPRTKSRHLTEDMVPYISNVIRSLKTRSEYEPLISGRRLNTSSYFFNDAEVESHTAIVPTGVMPSGLSSNEEKVYDLICRSVIRMLYPAAVVESTRVVTNVEGNDFISNGKVVVSKGWMEVSDLMKDEPLPELSEHERVSGTYKAEEKETKPPKRFTDATLLKAMLTAGKEINDAELRALLSDPKEGGIGTEATRAAIVKTLEMRGYIERSGKQVYATDKGIELIKKLPVEDLKSAEITAVWEKRLNMIAAGEENINTFLNDIYASVTRWCGEILHSASMSSVRRPSEVIGKCPKCGGDVKNGPHGAYCTAKCGMTISKIFGEPLKDTQIKNLLLGKPASFTYKKKKLKLLPEIVENEYKGKTYYNWKIE